MIMPKKWEAIASDPAHFGGNRREAVERCYALHCEPPRELADAEWRAIWDDAPNDSTGCCRFIVEAWQRKQREPQTVTVQIRFWRYTDSAKGRCEPRSFTSDEDDLTAEFPGGYTNAEWIGPAQTIEVVLP